jgi:hypothetical protein
MKYRANGIDVQTGVSREIVLDACDDAQAEWRATRRGLRDVRVAVILESGSNEVAERLAAMVDGSEPLPVSPPPVPERPASSSRPSAAAMQTWEVRGAFRDSGRDAVLTITAATQSAAEYEASQHGLLVESCWPVPPTAAVAEVPAGQMSLSYASPPPLQGIQQRQTPLVIEMTSKRFKWQMLAALGVMLVGILSSCIVAPIATAITTELGIVIFVLGLLCFIGGGVWGFAARLFAWWHHG